MKISSSKIYSLYIQLSMICGTGILFCIPLKIVPLKVLAILTMTILTVGMIIFSIADHFHHMGGRNALFLLLVGSCVLSWLFTGSSLENLEKAIAFLTLPILLLSAEKADVSRKVHQTICALFLALALFYTGLSFTPSIYASNHGIVYLLTSGERAVTLGYYNPNETAFYLLFTIMALLYLQGRIKYLLVRLLFVADAVYLCTLLKDTGSRTTAAVLLVAVILYAVYHFKKIRRLDLLAIFTAPVLYVAASFMASVVNALVIDGQDIFTGRAELYMRVFQNQDVLRFLIGDFGEFQFDNLHNGYVSIFATIGILGLAVMILLLYRIYWRAGSFISLTKIRQTRKGKTDLWLACCMLSLMLTTVTEAGFLTMGSSVAAGFASFYILLHYREEDGAEQSTPARRTPRLFRKRK